MAARDPSVARAWPVPAHREDQRDHRPEPPRRPGVARPARALHGSRRPAHRAERGERPVLCGLRPDGAQPPHGQPGPDPHRPPAAAGRPHAVRAGRRRHRHDRRPEGLRRAHPQLPRHRQGVGGSGAHARSSRSCRSRARTPRPWSTTTTGPRTCRRSTSSATSASTSRSTGCWPATPCAAGSSPASATPSSATSSCSRWTS